MTDPVMKEIRKYVTDKVNSKASARQSDERLLTILDRAYRGETLSRIADDMGLTKESVRTQTRRVLRADLAESGEPSGMVRLAYPWARV